MLYYQKKRQNGRCKNEIIETNLDNMDEVNFKNNKNSQRNRNNYEKWNYKHSDYDYVDRIGPYKRTK